MKKKEGLLKLSLLALLDYLVGCSTASFPTVNKVDLQRFMGSWYVAAGRFTILETEVHNAVEIYSYDEADKKIIIDFSYRRGSTTGKLVKIPQTAKVVEGTQNAHWLVSPFWPLKFDYLIIALDENYSWVAIGVPSQKYLWIMFRSNHPTEPEVAKVITHLSKIGYNTSKLVYVPQKW